MATFVLPVCNLTRCTVFLLAQDYQRQVGSAAVAVVIAAVVTAAAVAAAGGCEGKRR